ncbi:MAG: phosphoglycerate mutase family protein [Bacteroides cellulosilyticus]|nr:phosphoglycerate mutase family protein [Bacteroides cellulosilyticus]
MNDYLELAARNTRRAQEIVDELRLAECWAAEGVEMRPVGSLAMGLLCRHRDIDFHLYSSPVDVARSFAAVARLAAHPRVVRASYADLLETEERCLEWHLVYREPSGEEWTIDLIHIERGSRYDGYFERMAERIRGALTPETRGAILRLKGETPADEHLPGILYYMAVLRDGVRSMSEFRRWLEAHPQTGIVEWMP